MWRFWNTRGHIAEGRRRLESALRADERPTAARARALGGAGALAINAGDVVTARLRLEEGLELYRWLGDTWGTAHTTLNLGAAASEEGDLARAHQIFEESVGAFRELGDEYYTLWATRMLAWMCYKLGDRERALALHEDVVRQARTLGNEPMLATSLGSLADDAIRRGRVQDGLPMLKESTRIYRELGDLFETAINLCRFGRALALEARAGTAVRLLACSEVLLEEFGDRSEADDAWVVETNEETLTIIRKQLDEAAVAEAWEQGRALTLDEAVALALDSLD